MACYTAKTLCTIGSSKGVILPAKWLKKKKRIGVIAYNLDNPNDREEYYRVTQDMSWK